MIFLDFALTDGMFSKFSGLVIEKFLQVFQVFQPLRTLQKCDNEFYHQSSETIHRRKDSLSLFDKEKQLEYFNQTSSKKILQLLKYHSSTRNFHKYLMPFDDLIETSQTLQTELVTRMWKMW